MHEDVVGDQHVAWRAIEALVQEILLRKGHAVDDVTGKPEATVGLSLKMSFQHFGRHRLGGFHVQECGKGAADESGIDVGGMQVASLQ